MHNLYSLFARSLNDFLEELPTLFFKYNINVSLQ
jgi:hypothetical protein